MMKITNCIWKARLAGATAFCVGGALTAVAVAGSGPVTVRVDALPNAFDESIPREVTNDAPAGWGDSCWQGPAAGPGNKMNYHVWFQPEGNGAITLNDLFGAGHGIKISDIASISYHTKKGVAVPADRDVWLTVYTKPEGDSDDSGSWYDSRLHAIPDVGPGYSDSFTYDAWNLWSTDDSASSTNQMVFYDSARPGGNSGAYPTLSELGAGPVDMLAFMHDYSDEEVLSITLQTDSGWNGFDGYIDGLTIELTNGDVGEVNLIGGVPTLSLAATDTCLNAGDSTLTVNVDLSNSPAMIVGGQFFLEYNTSVLSFNSMDPGDVPFVLEIAESVDTGAGTIDYGVGVMFGGSGTYADTTMAVITFDVLSEVCDTSDLVTFRSHDPPTQVTDMVGTEYLPMRNGLGAVTIDQTPPTITCPPDVMVACIEDADPGLPYATVDGGVAIYYNDNGMGEVPSNQAYMQVQFDAFSPSTGAPLLFSSVPLTGFGPVTWQGVYSGLTPPDSQFGFDMVLPLPTMDGSVLPPVLTAYDNVDNTVPGAAPVGPVTWAINDYKPHTPDITAGDVINSIVRSQSPGVPASDVMILRNDVSQSGSIFTADIEGKLVSDGTHHWFNPATPHSPMSNFGLNGDIYYSGTLTYDVNTDVDPLMDFYEGTITLTANHISSVVGFATATDNCTLFPVIGYSDTDNGGSGCPGDPLVITRTWTATDDCGNQSSCVQTITVEDNVAPTFLSVPDDITVLAEAGGCTASVAPGMAEATDNCLAGATVSATRDDSMLLTDPYPAGDTTITWTATDACGNITMVDQIVTVEGESEMIIDLAFDGLLDNAVERCIEFVFEGADPTEVVTQEVVFDTAGTATGVSVLVPCGSYDCVTVRDPLHSLASSVDLTVSGTQYVASATGADKMLLGNLNGDLFVDILDFGIFTGQFGSTLPLDTDCLAVGPHSDLSGDTDVDSGDFTSIQINFLEGSDTGCTALVYAGGSQVPTHVNDGRAQRRPIQRISVNELRRRGMHDLIAADLNHDNWLDQQDIAAFIAGARP